MATALDTIRLADYQAPPVKVTHHDLNFDLREQATIVTHHQDITPVAADKTLVLNGEALELLEIAIDGKALDKDRYVYAEDRLQIKNPPATPFRLTTVVRIDPDNNHQLSGLYRSNGIYCTQCEAEGFRRISFTLDRPDVLATYRVRIEADKTRCPVLLSNGNLEHSGAVDDQRHYAQWFDPHPKPSYLFALVAGDLALHARHITTEKGKRIALHIYCEAPFLTQTGFAMQALIDAIQWDEKRFNLSYDLDRFNMVAISDFNMGAMENKSLNIFNTKCVLADYETATDDDFRGVQGVIGHEYFHNWTGNRVTCRDWFQLSLKEGLTVFRDQEFSADMNERDLERIDQVDILRRVQFAEDSGPMRHPVQPQEYAAIDNFYTSTVYEKGAEIIRMCHTILGEEAFQKGMALYISRHDGEGAN